MGIFERQVTAIDQWRMMICHSCCVCRWRHDVSQYCTSLDDKEWEEEEGKTRKESAGSGSGPDPNLKGHHFLFSVDLTISASPFDSSAAMPSHSASRDGICGAQQQCNTTQAGPLLQGLQSGKGFLSQLNLKRAKCLRNLHSAEAVVSSAMKKSPHA